MNERETYSAGTEARRDVPKGPPRASEAMHEEMLLRYLSAMSAVSTRHAAARGPADRARAETPGRPGGTHSGATAGTGSRPAAGGGTRAGAEPEAGAGPAPGAGAGAGAGVRPPVPAAAGPAPAKAGATGTTGTSSPLEVRDVMQVPAPSVGWELPFQDVARVLAREHAGSVAVVDADDRVVGVVSESDLLAKAAVEATEERPGPLRRIRERRLLEKAHGDSAETLMTSPAITVLPGTSVAEAAWLLALSRLKRVPVTDHEGHLVGTVHRNALLHALVRDDAGIRKEVRRLTAQVGGPATADGVEVDVRGGVVDLRGRMPSAAAARLVAEVRAMDDVVEVRDHLTSA
ncbi:CBS domain-containing protein [Streptomyces sp. NPDC020801]|uniref:CBS domain-containing protein n=1 Tax=unclassified Streptomyces TaxID=2593676 RepID=UPI0037AF9C56